MDEIGADEIGADEVVENGSRWSREAAGWCCRGAGAWADDVPAGTRSNSWLHPPTLLRCRNDPLAAISDPTDDQRRDIVRALRERQVEHGRSPDFVVTMGDEPVTMAVLGDPGEGDRSQYAVVPALAAVTASVDFGLICSDVIYPSGDASDYAAKFHHPYRHLGIPFYAVPGNHDWYDGLAGFLHTFCGYRVEPGARQPKSLFERLLWRRPEPVPAGGPDPARDGRVVRGELEQPAPYFAIDVAGHRLIGIDTGIRGTIDREQYEWLRRVAYDDAAGRPRILFTGKPIYVDNRHHPCRVSSDEHLTVDDIVTDPAANVVLVVGGDIHNYQHYPVTTSGGALIHYVVSGGGGAFMHATHSIPRVDVADLDETQFRCYPLRRDSLARFSEIIDRRLRLGGRLAITPEQAAVFFAQEKQINLLPRDDARPPGTIDPLGRIRARILHRIRVGRWFQRLGSVVFDWNDPPMFKQFLTLRLVPGQPVTVICYSVNGCAESEGRPSVEEVFRTR